ncbi:type I polyketide synthase [Legionella cardiaca]|uniref:SDR family NAD(P)-dependent oxidoreductase n=1 Tax=Legionella cardiaca TaxID=1071983 RepID=A0ABY8AS00_9GAMM|nr:type I polyketide synthase [Legionella cardiaca]WED42066.1 SDR family NAD(P)-dependent oxidoreductase [Legionella cardiaca]
MVDQFENILPLKIIHLAETQPEKIALKFLKEDYKSYQTLTYRQLKEQMLLLTDAILQTQLRQNLPLTQQPILLIFDSSIEYIISFLAILNSGNIAITAYPPRQVRHLHRLLKIIENSNASLVLTTEAIKNFCQENQFEFPQTSHLICIEELQKKRYIFEGIKPTVKPDYIAFLQYTSGSTGAPKGVVVTHQNIIANLDLMTHYLEERAFEKCVSWLPIFHDMGLVGNTLLPLSHGGTCVFMAPLTFLKNPLFWFQVFSQEKGTFSMAPNFAYDLVTEAFKKTDVSKLKLDFSHILFLVNGAEPVKPQTVRNFEQLLAPYGLAKNTVRTGYGMAETTLCISFEKSNSRFISIDKKSWEQGLLVPSKTPESQIELVSCGTVDKGLLRIVDPNSLQVLPMSQVGEIWVQSESVSAGYYNAPEKTKEIFNAFTSDTQEGPFLRTGDLGLINQNGALIVCGRLKDLIIINGRNIYPQDIERVCYESDPALIKNSAAAFSLENDSSEECIIIAEVNPDLDKTEYQRILGQIRKSVFESADIVPRDIVLIPPRKIFKTSSGKIQRSTCKNAYLQEEFEVIARLQQLQESMVHEPLMQQAQQTTDIIPWIKQWVSDHTQTPVTKIDINKAFAEYGMSSVELVAMIGDLEKLLRQPLDPWLVWEFPTIGSLSQRLRAEVRPQVIEETMPYEPIAIIGIDCLFPGQNYKNINGIEELWENLKENNDNIIPIPSDRWDNRLYYDSDWEKKGHMYCSEGGFLNNIKFFDAKFFNISPREATYLDPQQRLLLTVTWHALEDAGIAVESIKNSKTGIYLGISTHDYDALIQKNVPLEELNTYQATGTSFSTAAGRLAYFLGTQGPCMSIDTACSSSLVSIHQASRSLQDGDCHMAIAGGVNLILSPEGNIIFCKSHMLSPKNRCSTFDISADGYVRGEGCGVVILKKLRDAVQDGNKIYAVIHGSAVNQDGASNGLTAPNLNAQVDVIETALRRANLQATQITHVEAHGTGTELGDPIEWEGIRRTYGVERQTPLYITSLKTRIGHLEAAAGVAGLIKTVLAIKHGQIPAHLHLHQFNPKLHQQETMLVPGKLTNWNDNKRYAGVSSFGFSGTNAHIILGEAPEPAIIQEKVNRPNHLWVVSAQDKETLSAYIQNYLAYGEQQSESIHFASLCHHLLTKRTHLPYRAFVVAQSRTEWIEKLVDKNWQKGCITDENQMAWLFTGQGCLQANVAAQLYATLPPFAAIIEHCCALSKKWLPYDLREILLNTPESIDINNTTYAQPALFVYEYALAQWLLKLGLQPQCLLGHSLGEYVAACIAEIVSLEDALMLVCKRAMLFSKLPDNGSMLAITAPSSTVEPLIKNFNSLVIALKNGPTQIVVSGTHEDIAACQFSCQEMNIRCKKVATSHAFHSPLIKPIAEEFEKIASTINYKPGKIAVISNVTGKEIQNGQINAAYWRNHMLATVQFHQGLETIIEKGTDICLEIGPKPLLTSQIQETYDDVLALPTVSDCNQPWPGLLQTLGNLYLRGIDLNWQEFDKHHLFVEEPLLKYPFKGKNYWLPKFDPTPDVVSIENTWKSCLYQPQWEKLDWQPELAIREGTVVLISREEDNQLNEYISLLKQKFPAVQVVIYLSSNQQKEQLATVLQQADHFIYLCLADNEQLQNEMAFMMLLSQALIKNASEKPFIFLTHADSLTGTALLALLKSVQQEYPAWPLSCLQITKETDQKWLDFIFAQPERQGILRYGPTGHYEQQTIIPLDAHLANSDFKITAQDVCLITGAYGDIGQALIEVLSELGLNYIIAVGRRKNEPSWSTVITDQKAKGLQLHYCCCDVSDADEVEKLMKSLPAHFPPLTMIIHAAGTTIDQPWLETTEVEMNTILKAKALGAWYLHQATGSYSLKVFICISSLSAIFGNQGQAIYAAANSFLNALVSLRRNQNQAAQSLILGPVKNTGLFKKNEKALTAYLSAKGITPLTIEELKYIFKKQIQFPQLILGHFLKPLDEIASLTEPQEENEENNEFDATTVKAEDILKISQEILGISSGDLSMQDNWFDVGMDSIMAAQLAHQINRKYKRKCIVAKDIFTYASAELLAKKINQTSPENYASLSEQVRVRATTFPLSLQQQEIWNFLKQTPEKEAYQLPITIRIDSALSRDRLQEAISRVMARHDILRCSFYEVLGQVNQHVHEDCLLNLEFLDNHNEKDVVDFFNSPFDLTKAPLIKTKLIKQNETQYLWLLNFHHLICDGYTVTSFVHEVVQAYDDEPLKDPLSQYGDFISWQWDNVYYALNDDLKSYWQQRLENMPVTVPLAMETKQPMEAHVVSEVLALEKIKRSLNVLEKNNLSMSNFMLANLFDVLFATFQQEQLGIVVLFSGRENGEFATVFGDTSNDVVITSKIEPNIFTHSKLLQDQILSLGDKQYFRLPILKELGLNKPMISFDFQRGIELNLKTTLQMTMVKATNVQNYLWGDEPRLLSFKVHLSEDHLKFALKYRTDKIKKETAQTLLDNWLSRLLANENTEDATEFANQKNISYYEASALQANLWQLLKKHPNGLPYYVPLFKILNKDVDLQQLNIALQKTIQHNPSLRTSFIEQDKSIQWCIHSEVQTAIKHIETDHLYATLNNLLVEPIAPWQPPLLKAYLVVDNQDKENRILLLRLHHLVCDGLSAEQFLKELERWYYQEDRKDDIPSEDKHYLSRYQLEQSAYTQNLHHYANYIANINSLLSENSWLPADCQKPDFMGEVVYQQLSRELTEKILYFCQKNQFSLYAFYLYMFCNTLKTLVQEDKIYLSIVKSNRVSLTPQNMIGYYADNIPILVQISSSDDLIGQIKQIQIHIIGLIEQYQYSFLDRDMKKINYRQPQFIFNQYKADNESKLFQPADYLIDNLLEQGGKKVTLWNYLNPEKINLLVRSSNLGDMIGLAFNSRFFNSEEAQLFLQRMLKTINSI